MPKNETKNKICGKSYQELLDEEKDYIKRITKAKSNFTKKDLYRHLKRIQDELKQYQLNMYRKKGNKYENKDNC